MTDFDLAQELQPNLGSGEKLIWAGKPRTGIILRGSDVFMIPFSLLWGGFVVFWEKTVFASNGPLFFKLWGIPFVLAGLYFIIGRFFVDALKRSNTIYGITPDRIIIKSGVFNIEIKSLNIRTLSDISINEKSDGSGTITRGPTDFRYSMMQGTEWPGIKQPPKLEFIEDVKKVYDLIIEMQRQK